MVEVMGRGEVMGDEEELGVKIDRGDRDGEIDGSV